MSEIWRLNDSFLYLQTYCEAGVWKYQMITRNGIRVITEEEYAFCKDHPELLMMEELL